MQRACLMVRQMICPRLTVLLPSPCPFFLRSDAPSVKAEKDPVFVNLGETADLICVADANPVISPMFSWKWLVRALYIYTHT